MAADDTLGITCPANEFAFSDSKCLPVPPNAISDPGSNTWRCGDGSVGTYGIRRIETSCSNYTFSNTLNNNPPCSVFASGGPHEGSSNPSDPSGNVGWCVSCSIAGNCPGAWAKLDLGEVTNVAGLRVAGRSGACNYPTSFNALYSVDGITWIDVDEGNVFQPVFNRPGACSAGFADFLMYKPMRKVMFNAPVSARYIKVYPLTRDGTGSPDSPYASYKGWFMCMTFEALGISEVRSTVMLMYPFTSPSTLWQGFGSLATDSNNNMALAGGNGGTMLAEGGGVNFKPGEFMLSPWIDFSLLSEFTLTFWISPRTYYSDVLFGIQQQSNNAWFFSMAAVYGTSFWKVSFGPNKFNGYGWGQEPYGKNFIVIHGRRSGGKTYFYTGQLGASGAMPLGASNGMSNYYEFFDMEWPSTLRISLGSVGHRYTSINIKDLRLYRDGATSLAPDFFNGPSKEFPFYLDSCAVCQPKFYCANNQIYSCQANSSAGYHASSLEQCICNEGLIKENGQCRACKEGFYCPNQTSEIQCSGNCTGFTYFSVACSSSKDRVCTQCPATPPIANTPSACICGSNKYNNGSGGGCSSCPINTVSPTISYGKDSCTCIPGFISSQVFNNITNTSELFCKMCGDNTYSLANTMKCFNYPPNTTAVSWSPGFVCPVGYWLPTNVPVLVNQTTGYPDRPGLFYWNFEGSDPVNLWGPSNILVNGPARYFPAYTTPDISTLSPGLTCKFGSKCLLIAGMSTDNYKYTFDVSDIPMTREGLSVSFWLRINSCSSCSFYGEWSYGVAWNFGGVMARHAGGTGYGLAMQYIYNSIASSVYDWQVFGGTDQTDFRNFVNVWHHHLYVFKPEGILLGYLDGALKVKQNFNLAFPKIFSGSFFINKYFSGLVDDFAIFSGDMGPYVSALQASPANLVFGGANGINQNCIPCYNGTYCSNNTYQNCPTNKTAVMRSESVNDCICNPSGSYGKALDPCISCPTNSYCEGGGLPDKPCTGNYYSAPGSIKPRDCLCLSPFTVNSSGYCGCMAPFTQTNISGSGPTNCECGAGYTGLINNLTEDSIINPIAGCGSDGAACSSTVAVGRVYAGSLSNLIDDNPCTSLAIWGGPYKIVFDLGKIHFIKNISFIPGQSCTASLMYRTNTMEISTSVDDNINGFFAWHADTYDSNTPLRTFKIVPPVMRFARYIILSGVSPLLSGNYPDFFSLSELKVTAYPSPCTQCPAGFYCPNNDINNMLPCTIGHHCPAGSVQPLDCGNFAFSSVIGASQCTSCPVNSYTVSTTATSLSECRCSPGYSGVANFLNPELQTLNLTKPQLASMYCPYNTPAQWGDLNKLFDGIGLNSQNDNYPSCYSSGTQGYVQYDMGSVIPISKIVANPFVNGYAMPYASIQVSKTGKFAGEQTEIFVTTCNNIANCPAPAVTSVGYVIQMFPIFARYVRWYMTFGTTTNWQQLAVYQCLGPTCYSCTVCPYHSYCPANIFNDTTYACPNNTYTFADSATTLNGIPPLAMSDVSNCTCPSHSSINTNYNNCSCDFGYIPIVDKLKTLGWKCLLCAPNSTMYPGADYCTCDYGFIYSAKNTAAHGWQCILCANNSMMLPNQNYCSCNAGYYKTYNKDPVYGWQCDMCPPPYTSEPNSVNISSCYCGKGLIGLNNTVAFKTYGVPTASSSVSGTLSTLYNGISNWEYWNLYVYDSGASCTGRVAWVQYDMGSIGLIQDVSTLSYADGRLYCKWSIQISTTGAFNGEQTVAFSCGNVAGTYCPGGVRGAGVFTKFPPILGRYVRWYIGGSNSGSGAYFVKFLVNFGPPCYICPSKSYCPSLTAAEKYICPNNTYSYPGAVNVSQCICPLGSSLRATSSGNFNCSCDEGFYYNGNVLSNSSAATLASWKCDACRVGLSSPADATDVSQCICGGGYYPTNLPSRRDCTQCPAKSYCSFNVDFPVPCGVGTTSLAGASSCDLPCPPGFHCPGDATHMPCPAGTYSPGGSGLSCTTCEAGHYCNATTTTACPPEFYCPLSTTPQPIPCPSGTYMFGSGAAACTPCDAGFYCTDPMTKIPCPTIFYCPTGSAAPIPCDPGLYSCSQSATCGIQCPPGGYCPGNGTVVKCMLGMYSNGGATSNCTLCEPGFFCDFTLQLSVAGCVN